MPLDSIKKVTSYAAGVGIQGAGLLSCATVAASTSFRDLVAQISFSLVLTQILFCSHSYMHTLPSAVHRCCSCLIQGALCRGEADVVSCFGARESESARGRRAGG